MDCENRCWNKAEFTVHVDHIALHVCKRCLDHRLELDGLNVEVKPVQLSWLRRMSRVIL